MFHSSRTTLKELKKRYLNILKKCLLVNLMMFAFSLTAHSGTATDASSLIAELEKNERTVVETGTHLLTYDKTSSLYDTETNSIIFPNVTTSISLNAEIDRGRGGKFGNLAEVAFESDLKLVFKDNFIHVGGSDSRIAVLGNTIYNTGTLTFNAEVDFLNNHGETTVAGGARVRGAVYNEGKLNFNQHVNFKNNTGVSLIKDQMVETTSLYNNGGTVVFKSADFIGNQAGREEDGYVAGASALRNQSGGKITFTEVVNFEDNKAFDKAGLQGAVILNKDTDSTITFLDKATFKNNGGYTQNTAQAYGGAVMNGYIGGTTPGAKIEFADVEFIGNKAIAASDGIGGAVYNRETLIFNGEALFQGNIAQGKTGYASGGALNNGTYGIITFKNQAIFKDNRTNGANFGYGGAVIVENTSSAIFEEDVLFSNNKAEGVTSGQGGALRIGFNGTVTFKDNVVFQENLAKGITALGGAIMLTRHNSTLNFENGFYFVENKEVVTTTNEDDTTTETENLNDIYISDGVINIMGTNLNTEEYVGGGIKGDEGMGTINKSSVATLVFGEESDNTGFSGVFNQTAGKTVAKSETFLGGTNNILGGELETHGSEILYTAVVGQNKDETTGEVLSSGTLTHLALGSEPVEIKGLSFKEEGTNLLMTFKNGTSERAHYQLNEDVMNATGNKLAFENSELALADNIKVSGTIEAKNSEIDVGTKEVSVDEISLKENAVLKMTVNSLDEHGKVNGVITGVNTSKIALQLGVDLEKGIYQLFDRDNEVQTASNALFNIKDLEDGSFEIGKKTAEELSSSLSVGQNEGKALSAMMMRMAPQGALKAVQEEVLEALQSEDESTVETAKESLKALSGRSTSLYQSQATAGFTQLHNVVSQMLMNTAAPVFGHAGGEEPARASVYVKGLYDRVNSLTG
ncbi:MAG: hypothetical protein J6V53_04370, partial [Alphaproteobacteria bacterium]|nr:hypothetical protein [Alphaproteobacteria bacterium]